MQESLSPSNQATETKRFGPLSAVLVTLGAFFGSQLLAGVIIGMGLKFTGKNTSQAAQNFTDSTAGRFLFVLIVEIFTLAFIFWFIRRRGIKKSQIGLARRPKKADLANALGAFIFYFILLAIVMYFIGRYLPGINIDQKQQIGFESSKGGASLTLVFISLVVLPPITEEIMIRGFLYGGLKTRAGRLGGALLASLIFGAAHLQLGQGAPPLYVAAIDTFILSMVLIGLRERTGSIWAGMVVHALKNGLAFGALFLFNAG